MHLSDALALLDPKWAKDFVSFVENGEASDEFIAFLDSSKEAQRAVDMVLEQESGKVARVAQLIRDPAARPAPAAAAVVRPTLAESARIAAALSAALDLPAARRAEVIKEAVATLKDTSNDPEAVESMVSELAQQAAIVR